MKEMNALKIADNCWTKKYTVTGYTWHCEAIAIFVSDIP